MTAAVVLFDFGGVVIKTPFELLDVTWRGPFDPSTDPEWRRFQAGEMTERQYWRLRADQLVPGAAEPMVALMRLGYDQPEDVVVRAEVRALLDELDVRVAALTNDLSAFHPPEWIERMTVLRRFDPLIDLSSAGVLKPDPRAYAIAVQRLGLDASQIVFVDDQRANVAGAEAFGMTAVHFDPTDITASLDRVRHALH